MPQINFYTSYTSTLELTINCKIIFREYYYYITCALLYLDYRDSLATYVTEWAIIATVSVLRYTLRIRYNASVEMKLRRIHLLR